MKTVIFFALIVLVIAYSIIGTSGNVEQIKSMVPSDMTKRNWTIMRYEGYGFGSFAKHGGKVWYHVEDDAVINTYYRVHITLWNGELQYYYNKPETLNRIDVSYQDN